MAYEELKYVTNNTLGTPAFKPLDDLLCAKIVCRGSVGCHFLIHHKENFYPDFEFELDEGDRIIADNLWARNVSVPLGNYKVTINDHGTVMSSDIAVTEQGGHHVLKYASYTELKVLEQDGSFTVPQGVNQIFVTGIAGGGAGNEGGYISSYSASDSDAGGGGGGGHGEFIIKKAFSVTPGQQINVTIGKGGTSAGQSGGSTVIGNLVTLKGGTGGGRGHLGRADAERVKGAAGSPDGGYGGIESTNGGAGGNNGGAGGFSGVAQVESSRPGTGYGPGTGPGKAGGGGGGGGGGGITKDGVKGGGGKGGNGGDGTRYTKSEPGGHATYYGGGGGGSGGAGYRYQQVGEHGNGKDGIVVFYKGIVIN